MYTLVAENKYGQQLELTDNEAYTITSIEGLDPPDAVINTTKNANADGSVFNSSYISDRQIIITMAINYPAEENRINLYTYFKSKMPITLYYTNETRDVFITGYVQNFSCDLFAKKQIAQITIQCPKPLFNDNNSTNYELSQIENLFEFPFEIDELGIEFSAIEENNRTIVNNGDVETGALIKIHALGPVSNPIIYNVETNEYFGLIIDMAEGDDIIINTKQKEKEVIQISDGTTTNVIGKVRSGSTWLQFIPGPSEFTMTAEGLPENIYATVTITNLYEGV